jgi:hypothetical protein
MLLIDASKLDYVKVSSHGLFKVGEVGSPEEYRAVTSPIKVKLAHDVLVLLYANTGDDDERPSITYSVLNSTKRKFKDDYVTELIRRKTTYDGERALLRFKHSEG